MCPNCDNEKLNLLDNKGNWHCTRCGSRFSERELEDYYDVRDIYSAREGYENAEFYRQFENYGNDWTSIQQGECYGD